MGVYQVVSKQNYSTVQLATEYNQGAGLQASEQSGVYRPPLPLQGSTFQIGTPSAKG